MNNEDLAAIITGICRRMDAEQQIMLGVRLAWQLMFKKCYIRYLNWRLR